VTRVGRRHRLAHERVALSDRVHGDPRTDQGDEGDLPGYATIGTDDAIVVELDESHQELKGKLRLIPLHVVLAVDILEQVPGDAPKVEKHGTMYG